MQISDLTRQYNGTTATDAMTENRGVEKLVSTVRELTAGNIFEGTVNSISNGKVVLGLSNGSELAARLEANMQLVKGQSMFFQVKSNDGEMIAIRPYTVDGAGANLTLMNALKAANLPVTAKNINMVNAMMQEQMPINQNGLAQMSRVLIANPDMSVNTLVQMKKLDIPITGETVAQFENYMDDAQAIHKELNQFVSNLPQLFDGKEMTLEQIKSFDSQLLQIIAGEPGAAQENSQVAANATNVQQSIADANENTINTAQKTDGMDFTVTDDGVIDATMIGESEETVLQQETAQLQGKTTQDKVVQFIHNLFEQTGITKEDSANVLLNKLANYIQNNSQITKEELHQLFSNKDIQQLLRDVLEEQMYMAPKDVANKEKVQKFFERLKSKTQALSNLLANTNITETPLAQTVADVHNNIEFMNQINETYTYVQIPLKMTGQNASGQLYVYTNKRDLADPDKDLTAFLHLDMDHLGSTDISVRLRKKEVDTKFYMEDDASYNLIKAHAPELEQRLKSKGFNCNVYVENEGKKVNFVEDFLKKDAPSAGQLHRYSFDVRA